MTNTRARKSCECEAAGQIAARSALHIEIMCRLGQRIGSTICCAASLEKL
jgi:hypothetical protein